MALNGEIEEDKCETGEAKTRSCLVLAVSSSAAAELSRNNHNHSKGSEMEAAGEVPRISGHISVGLISSFHRCHLLVQTCIQADKQAKANNPSQLMLHNTTSLLQNAVSSSTLVCPI